MAPPPPILRGILQPSAGVNCPQVSSGRFLFAFFDGGGRGGGCAIYRRRIEPEGQNRVLQELRVGEPGAGGRWGREGGRGGAETHFSLCFIIGQ